MSKESDQFMNEWHGRMSRNPKVGPPAATSLKLESMILAIRELLITKKVCTEKEFDELFVANLKGVEAMIVGGRIQYTSPIPPESLNPPKK